VEYLPSILLVLQYQSRVPPFWHSARARSVTIEFEWEGLLTRSHTPRRHVCTEAIQNLKFTAAEYLPSILLVL